MKETCRFCGGEIVETPMGWFCENAGEDDPHFVLYKDSLKRLGGVSLDEHDAIQLNRGNTVKVQLRSRKTGRWYTARIAYDASRRDVKLLFDKW